MCLWGGVSKLITCSAFSALMIFYVILVKILNILGFSLTFISLFLYFVLGLIANLVFRIWFIYNLIHQLSPSFFCNLVILVPNPEFGR